VRLRSALYLPASNLRAIAKARGLACDAVILDLEDAVAPDAKDVARSQAVEALREDWGGRAVVVRINAPDTDWGREDIAALADADCAAVLVPKVNAPADLHTLRARLPRPALWAMIETPMAVLDLGALALAAGELRLTTFVAGTNDLAKELRCKPDAVRTPLLPALAQIVLAARAAGLIALDGVLNALGDPERLRAECEQGAMLGFDGKTLIHPDQIAAANAAFGPTEAERAWARRVAEAFAAPEAAGKGAIRLDGEMVERLHLAEAERILAS
jgi:citrate lyase subunit beta / citryl-CoA lyase